MPDNDKYPNYEHKPKRAVLWSLFPGGGQIYNEVGYRRIPQKKHRAWWKVPIIWGGLGACGYYTWYNFRESKFLKEEVLYRRENGDSTNLHSHLAGFTSEATLLSGYSYQDSLDGNSIKFRPGFDVRAKRRIVFLASSIGIFALAMIEAYVDAHFVTFDVSEDLGLSIVPVMFDQYSPGVSFRFSFL